MRHGSLGNGGGGNETPKKRGEGGRGGRILRLGRNAPERDRPTPAPGGKGREQGAPGRHHRAWTPGARTSGVSCGRLPPLLVAGLAIFAGPASGTAPRPPASPAGALVVTFDIPVDPGAADYVHRAAQAAIASNQDLVIVMNTPGGLLDSMAEIVGDGGPIADVQSHGLSVYTYVPPVGFAASAGSYIALATNAIYMGNGSVIGPSTPYIIGGDPSQIQHVQNFATGLIRSLAQKNGDNVRAAVDMAENNTAYTAGETASLRLIPRPVDTYAGVLPEGGVSRLPGTGVSEPFLEQFLSFLS